VNPPMPVYKGGDGRRSGAMTISGGRSQRVASGDFGVSARVQALEAEGSRLMALGVACACTSLGSRRGDGFGIIIAKTWGACVIAII
jgi:hypothetical protein